ncbi:MMPL family transporter [Mycobacterium sp. M1]|uniref:MMPL family transporter n=1 Tax=Mycolicibacter acidiphilus TaxID=2835306 RepID=A0ABS5RGX8_9MYCO|nr:MMPL family transporter [Mycolicibacter acidiphilus]MBS9532219.1 MMPL family transporter [Mycolicibacter acidiphilus]
MSAHQARRRLPHSIRMLAVPIIGVWLALTVITNIVVPNLETVAKAHQVGMSSPSAPSLQAMKHIGRVFEEFDSDSAAMIVLEGDAPLGDDAHRFYDTLIGELEADTKHVEHVQDFWGDPLTASAAQSTDGKAALVQVYLAGNQGDALSSESVDTVRRIVQRTPAPPGVTAYVTGASPLITDQFEVGNEGILKVTLITFAVIVVMLLWVYRSLVTTLLVLITVLVEVAAARGVVAVMGNYSLIELSTFSVNILTLLAIAAGTDYAIFFVGRYQEARGIHEDRATAFDDMFHGTAHVVLGSGLTITGAVYCLTFARQPYFQSMGVPAAVGMIVSVASALTLAPAVLAVGSRFGLFEPKVAMRTREWRRIGTAIVRWPGPILVVTIAVALIGLLALPGYRTSYDSKPYLPDDTPAKVGYAAAERHFSQARLNPELLMVEADHDLRDPADMLVLERIAKNVFHTPGIAKTQAITRPLGVPLDHSSIPFQLSQPSVGQVMNLQFQKERAADLLKQAGILRDTIGILRQQYSLQQQSAAATHEQTQSFQDTIVIINEMRDRIANLLDFFRPIQSYFYWEPHCYDIPLCFALRNGFDTADSVDQLGEQFASITASLDKLDALQPQLIALLPPQIDDQLQNLELTLSNYATNSGINGQAEFANDNPAAMGQAFDKAKNDDSFYLPPEVFANPDFKRGLKLFVSPDGRGAQMIITHDGDPATPEGISHISAIRNAAKEAVKGTPLEGSHLYIAGTAATYKDIQEMVKYDLMIVGVAALSLILLIMMFITGSLVAAIVIVGTVALSLGASFGLSVLVWQDILGIELYWVVLALAVILLLAVGSDYNLLLISRFKEEIGAGLNTGIIRAMAGSGSVVTSAGLVFAATMSTFAFSQLVILGQVGTTIGLGLLFDTLIVRSFMTPSIAALLGRWFWWPLSVRPRPASAMLRAYGTRQSVRELLQGP